MEELRFKRYNQNGKFAVIDCKEIISGNKKYGKIIKPDEVVKMLNNYDSIMNLVNKIKINQREEIV